MADNYEDIMGLPHYEPQRHTRMPRSRRAAQFAPFAALSGYADVIRETARLTEPRIEPDVDAMAELDRRIRLVEEHIQERPEVVLTVFCPDADKAGGSYETVRGQVKQISLYDRCITMEDGSRIPMDDITDVRAEWIKEE